ncbi:hypothetical protein Tco_1504000 [Tanacetum coccineum]
MLSIISRRLPFEFTISSRSTALVKESSLTTDDNIIYDDPDAALELAKSINKTEAKEQEAARLVYETHECLVTEKPTERRRQTGVVFRDTPTVQQKKPLDQSQKLKGVQVMSVEERSSEGAGSIPEVPDEPTIGPEADDDSEDNWGTKSNNEVEDIPWVDTDDDKDDDDEEEDNDDDQSIDLEETDDEENLHDNDETQRDEYVHEDEYVHVDDDERTELDNKDQAIDDTKMNDDDKVEKEKDTDQEPIQEQAKYEVAGVLVSMTHKEKPILLISTSSQSVSSNYSYQFLISSPEHSLLGTVKESEDAEITSMVDVQIQQEIPVALSVPLLDVLASAIPPTPPPIQTTTTTTAEAPSSTTVIPDSKTLSTLQLRVSDLEQEKPNEPLEKDSQKSVADIYKIKMEHAEKNKSYLKHLTHEAYYEALTESLILDEDDMEKAKNVEDSTQKKRQNEDRDQDPSAGPDQGLKKRKTSKDAKPSKKPKLTGSSKHTTSSQPKSTRKSMQAEEIVFEAIDTVISLNQGDDMGNAEEKLNVETSPMTDKSTWFTQPSRPPTPDPEWNKGKLVENTPAQNWLNDLANAEKPPLTFNDLMSNPIDFSTFVMNRLKISKLTKSNLVGSTYNLLKGTCKSCVELEYNMKKCHLTVPVDFFFNNDLEYLRGGSTDRKYTASITKTKAAKYDVEGIEDMVPKFCSLVKVAYEKVSKHDVYLTMRILSVTSVTIDEWYGYGYLKEIVMRRADQKLYKFMEGDFLRLHLNDIEDILLLFTQNKLNNLDRNVTIYLVVGLPLRRHLEEIHVTWAQFWKKSDKMANGYDEGTKNCNQNMETTFGKDVMPSGSTVNNEALKTLAWQWRLDCL